MQLKFISRSFLLRQVTASAELRLWLVSGIVFGLGLWLGLGEGNDWGQDGVRKFREMKCLEVNRRTPIESKPVNGIIDIAHSLRAGGRYSQLWFGYLAEEEFSVNYYN